MFFLSTEYPIIISDSESDDDDSEGDMTKAIILGILDRILEIIDNMISAVAQHN